MRRTVIAIERDGLSVQAISIQFEIPHKDFDLVSAVKAAATDYCKTSTGRNEYEGNCGCFNWADFDVSVPNAFCLKHGFSKTDSEVADMLVNWDEQLVNDEELEESAIQQASGETPMQHKRED